ncbi:hypothetical protein WJX81_006475 [Elliptochloris bilobata]|uniref:Kelch repeat-containing protein n=1 Tax=Elliptochloris bilobata TaxID=381761 RepID=A0AAW1SHQ8_9CHLO
MGSGRDKRKKQKGKQPGLGASKTEKKTANNATKELRRAEKTAAGGEDDLDALLAQFQLSDKLQKEVQVLSEAPAPSPRVFASFTPIPTQKDDILLFGGEYYDSKADKMRCYNDIFIYSPRKDRWTQVISPGGPAPRSSHQAAVHRGFLYMFGGELMSPNQQSFKHYQDLWRMDLERHTWELLPGKGGPQGRSGHRMALHKNKLLTFGGFNDSGKACQYFNDLWEYDIEELRWRSVPPGSAARPSPRGGSQVAVAGDTLFLYGGHSVEVDPADKSETETVHDDMWALDLLTYQWERVRRAGMAPSPRTSFGLATHRQRAVLFGGITDRAGAGDKLFSEMHNELYQFSFASRRWFPLALRARRGLQQADKAADKFLERGGFERGSALHRAAVRIQANYRGYAVRKAYTTYKLGGPVSELLYSPATYGIDFAARDAPRPRARANPMLAVCGNTLWLLGGVVEVAHTDVTLDDLWCLDLAKLDGWRCVRANTAGEDAFRDDSSGWEEEGPEGQGEGSDSD